MKNELDKGWKSQIKNMAAPFKRFRPISNTEKSAMKDSDECLSPRSLFRPAIQTVYDDSKILHPEIDTIFILHSSCPRMHFVALTKNKMRKMSNRRIKKYNKNLVLFTGGKHRRTDFPPLDVQTLYPQHNEIKNMGIPSELNVENVIETGYHKVGQKLPVVGIITKTGEVTAAYRFNTFLQNYFLMYRKDFDIKDYDFVFKFIEVTEEHRVPDDHSDDLSYFGYVGQVVGTDETFHNQYPKANSQNQNWRLSAENTHLDVAKEIIKERPISYVTTVYALDELKDWIAQASDDVDGTLTKAVNLYKDFYQKVVEAYPEFNIHYLPMWEGCEFSTHVFVRKV